MSYCLCVFCVCIGSKVKVYCRSCASPSTQRKTIQELPSTVNEFLVKLGLQDRQEQFVLNGYDNMDVIKKIDRVVLDELGITEAQQRKAILTLVKQLNDASSIGNVYLFGKNHHN